MIASLPMVLLPRYRIIWTIAGRLTSPFGAKISLNLDSSVHTQEGACERRGVHKTTAVAAREDLSDPIEIVSLLLSIVTCDMRFCGGQIYSGVTC